MNGSSRSTVSLGAFVGFGVTMYFLGRGNLLHGLNIQYVGYALTLQIAGFLIVMMGQKYGKRHWQAITRSDTESNFGTVVMGLLLTGISVIGLCLMSATVFVPGLGFLLALLRTRTTAFVAINQMSFVNSGVVALLLVFAAIVVRQLLPTMNRSWLGNLLGRLHLPSRKQRSEQEIEDFDDQQSYAPQPMFASVRPMQGD